LNEPRKGAKGAKIKAFCSAIVQSHSFSRRFVRGIIVKGIGRRRRNTIPLISPLLTESKKAKKWRQKISCFYIFASIFLPFSLLLAGRPCASLPFGCGLAR
jgi:hypothetical protein